MSTEPTSIECLLRQAVLRSGMSITAVAKAVGVCQPTLRSFVYGAGIKLVTAEKLARYFGYELRKRER